MIKKIVAGIFSVIFLFNMYGCFALFAGAVGGAGTAVWLSGKLSQDFNADYIRTVNAAKSALKSLNLSINKESQEEHVTQIRSEYSDGKDIWIDIHKITENTSKVEVRVGVVSPDKEAAEKILSRMQRYL